MMSRAKQILILVIIAAAVVAGMAIKMNLTSTSSVQANQGAGGGVRTWEYCAITRVSDESDNFNRKGKAVIRYFGFGGVREQIVEFVPGIGEKNVDPRDEALARALARLGAERWEMVSKESDTEGKFKPFYFKRPNP
jgi:hypothetical protein